MKEFSVDSLQPGMMFSDDLYMDQENIIVPSRIAVKQKDIDRLRKWNIVLVYSDGDLLEKEAAGSGGLQGMIQNAFASPAQKEVTKLYGKYALKFSEYLKDIAARTPPDSMEIKDLIDRLIELIEGHRDDVIQYILYGKHGESNEAENAINAAILSMLIGMEMNMVSHRIHQLGASALLRDVGMVRIPEQIRSKTGKLSPEELLQIKTHPVHSYRIITKEIGFPEDVGLPAMQHQERWDGQGYPKGIKGSEISTHARIISIADAFEAMVSQRSYRDAMIGYTAMRTILSDNGRRFDPEILRVFIRTLGIYPIGSIVQLSNAAIGRVVEHRPDAPLRPRIKIMVSEKGKAYLQDEGELVDLAQEKQLFIAKAVDPKSAEEANQN